MHTDPAVLFKLHKGLLLLTVELMKELNYTHYRAHEMIQTTLYRAHGKKIKSHTTEWSL